MTDSYYDQTARNYNELHGVEQKQKIDLILSKVNIKKSYKVLDVGCGTGLSSEISENTIGIDPSIELLKQNKKECACAYAEHLPFKDKTFDAVISLTAIQNFTDIKKGLEEIKRVGKNLFILTILKRSSKVDETRLIINNSFSRLKIEELQEEKDIIFIISKN